MRLDNFIDRTLSRINLYHIFFVVIIVVLFSLGFAKNLNEPIKPEVLEQIKNDNPSDIHLLEKNRLQVLFMKERSWFFIFTASLVLSILIWISLSNRKRSRKSYTDYKHNLTDKLSRGIKEQLDFQERLRLKFVKLTTNDILVAEMLVDGLSSKDISSKLNISPASVNTARYRLRKKMMLSADTDLLDALRQI